MASTIGPSCASPPCSMARRISARCSSLPWRSACNSGSVGLPSARSSPRFLPRVAGELVGGAELLAEAGECSLLRGRRAREYCGDFGTGLEQAAGLAVDDFE